MDKGKKDIYTAIVVCNQPSSDNCPRVCPFYELDDCPEASKKGLDRKAIAADALFLANQMDTLLAALTHAATEYIDQNGSVPSWWTDKIRKMVKPTCDELAKG